MIWGTTKLNPKTMQFIPVVKLVLSGSQLQYQAPKYQGYDEELAEETARQAATAAQAAAEAKLIELGFTKVRI